LNKSEKDYGTPAIWRISNSEIERMELYLTRLRASKKHSGLRAGAKDENGIRSHSRLESVTTASTAESALSPLPGQFQSYQRVLL
jgi:hypothetical protein